MPTNLSSWSSATWFFRGLRITELTFGGLAWIPQRPLGKVSRVPPGGLSKSTQICLQPFGWSPYLPAPLLTSGVPPSSGLWRQPIFWEEHIIFILFSSLCSRNMDKGLRAKIHVYNASLESQFCPWPVVWPWATNKPLWALVNRVKLSPTLENHVDNSMREFHKSTELRHMVRD